MKTGMYAVLALFLMAGIIWASGAMYTIDETQQVVLTQFGEPVGKPITQAGLHFKIPFIQTANYFEKRIMSWDGDPNQIPTRDKRYIWVDTTARWRIADALKFMQSVGTLTSAQARLDDIVDSATRDAISNLKLVETIRSTNRLVEQFKDIKQVQDLDVVSTESLESISVGREELTRKILMNSAQIVPQYGIQLIDVRIKRVNYVQEVQKKVFDRMISERKRAAEQYRSEGQGKKAEIEGQMAKELRQIRSEAYKKGEEIKGKADAQAIAIYAQAYNNDPEFFAFLKTLEAYQETINADTTLMLTTESDFYKYFKSIENQKNLP